MTQPSHFLHHRYLPELRAIASTEINWLWEGYLAQGSITLLTSQWKAGKTTLLTLLLARLKQGGMLAGQRVQAGKALVLSEEDPSLWCQRSQHLDLDGQVCWSCQPFLGKPTREQWQQLLKEVLAVREPCGLNLFAIDPLAAFLPGGDENNAASIMEALAPLRRLTREGMAVLILHHPRKGSSSAGQAARGSGALLGFVDVLIEMSSSPHTGKTDRRRRLEAWSRFQSTPRQLWIELAEDGLDYLVREEAEVDEPVVDQQGLLVVLQDASYKLTRKQILTEWPPDFSPPPSEMTLSRWLKQGVEAKQICRDGSGHRNDPFRYWLEEREKQWREDPFFEIREELEENARRMQREGVWVSDDLPAESEDEGLGDR
jgi:archaellum biogenesis ATPase FlaH